MYPPSSYRYSGADTWSRFDARLAEKVVNSRRLFTSKRETAKMRVHKYRMLGYKGKLIQARIGDYAVNLGAGFRDRILFDQQRPPQLIRHHIARMLAELESPDG
jgi:hypothetical protein